MYIFYAYPIHHPLDTLAARSGGFRYVGIYIYVYIYICRYLNLFMHSYIYIYILRLPNPPPARHTLAVRPDLVFDFRWVENVLLQAFSILEKK